MTAHAVSACLRATSPLLALRPPTAPSFGRTSITIPLRSPALKLFEDPVNAEPLYLYINSGYHPVHLGDYLKGGRYKILYKLGWSDSSTVWAARDQNQDITARQSRQGGEISILRTLAKLRSDRPGHQHLMTVHDIFQVDGPNGAHSSVVSEILGPNIADAGNNAECVNRYPAKIMKSIVKETLLSLCLLHEQGMVHGELHMRNIAFTVPSVQAWQEQDFVQNMGEPDIESVDLDNDAPFRSGMPRYRVATALYPYEKETALGSTKIIDFSQCCFASKSPSTEFQTPVCLLRPEQIFDGKLDHQMDIWSLGCMLFELVSGNTPFNTVTQNPASTVARILESTEQTLPRRWQRKWRRMAQELQQEDEYLSSLFTHSPTSDFTEEKQEELSLKDWMECETDLSEEDQVRVYALINGMLCLEPAERPSARKLLEDPWFVEG